MSKGTVPGTAFTDGDGVRPEWAFRVCTSAEAREWAKRFCKDDKDPLSKLVAPGHHGIDPALCLLRIGECMAACFVDIASFRMLDGVDPYAEQAVYLMHDEINKLTALTQYVAHLPVPMHVWRRLTGEGQ